jgi:transposase
MDRFVLTDAQWAKMEPLCLGKPSDPGRSGKDNRLFVEAVLWIARTGSPWRDLPPSLGHWNSVFTRFRDWVKVGVFKRLFDAVSDDPDMEYAMARGSKVVISQHPRSTPLTIDLEMYKWRHLIENFFCKLKEFKRIALRADKTDLSFAAMIHLAAAVINSR